MTDSLPPFFTLAQARAWIALRRADVVAQAGESGGISVFRLDANRAFDIDEQDANRPPSLTAYDATTTLLDALRDGRIVASGRLNGGMVQAMPAEEWGSMGLEVPMLEKNELAPSVNYTWGQSQREAAWHDVRIDRDALLRCFPVEHGASAVADVPVPAPSKDTVKAAARGIAAELIARNGGPPAKPQIIVAMREAGYSPTEALTGYRALPANMRRVKGQTNAKVRSDTRPPSA